MSGCCRCIEVSILARKSICGNTAAKEFLDKGILDVQLPVVLALGAEIGDRHVNLSLTDGHIDAAQVGAVLIRPENRLRPRVADAVRLVEIVRSRTHIVVDVVEVRRAVGVILHRPCVGNHIRLAAHDGIAR